MIKNVIEDIDKEYLSADLVKNVTVAAHLAAILFSGGGGCRGTFNSLLYSFYFLAMILLRFLLTQKCASLSTDGSQML